MLTKKVLTFICDGKKCKSTVEVIDDPSSGYLDAMISKGWRLTIHNDYCPTCAAERGEEK